MTIWRNYIKVNWYTINLFVLPMKCNYLPPGYLTLVWMKRHSLLFTGPLIFMNTYYAPPPASSAWPPNTLNGVCSPLSLVFLLSCIPSHPQISLAGKKLNFPPFHITLEVVVAWQSTTCLNRANYWGSILIRYHLWPVSTGNAFYYFSIPAPAYLYFQDTKYCSRLTYPYLAEFLQ